MQHFVYSMMGHAPAPAGGGTTAGWFLHYKWDVSAEVFVPFPNESLPDDVSTQEGDLLWFVLDGRVIGCVPVRYFELDPMRPVVEVYYHTDQIQAGPLEGIAHRLEATTGIAQHHQVNVLNDLKLHFDAAYPPRASG